MKALVLILFILLVLAHPVTAAAVLTAELGACATLGWLIWRAVPLNFYRSGRTA